MFSIDSYGKYVKHVCIFCEFSYAEISRVYISAHKSYAI